MQRVALLIAIILSSMALPTPAQAEVHYYLEIGDTVKEQQAVRHWDELKQAHETLLGGLSYYPKTVYRGGKKDGVLIQAGPVAEKQEAHDICKQLFAADTPCFVIENLQEAPPKSVTTFSAFEEKQAQASSGFVLLPWLSARSEAEDVQQDKETGALDRLWAWLTGDEEAKVAGTVPEPVSVESHDLAKNDAQAEVEVAEAIRVPLTDAKPNRIVIGPDEDAPVVNELGLPAVETLVSSPVVTTSEVFRARRAPIGNPSAELVSDGAGWLIIAAFRNEEEASAAWNNVRTSIPEKAAGLRVRIVHPVASQYEAETTINVGPFASNDDAMAFCNSGVRRIDSSLVCNFSADENTRTAGNARHEREMLLAARRNALLSTSAGAGKRHHDQSSYWVEVIRAPNQMEALHAWEDLRTAHSDLFGERRSNVSRKANDEGDYVVRVGPIPQDSEARKLCHDLKDRDVPCHIVISSR